MKKFVSLLKVDLYRSVSSARFLGAVFLITLMMIFSTQVFITMMLNDALYLVDNVFSGTGNAHLILCMIPLLPYATSYASDEQSRAIPYWISRSGSGNYILSKFTASFLSAFFCVAIAFCLYLGFVMLIGYPFYAASDFSDDLGYGILYNQGHALAYWLCTVADRGMTAGMMACCAMCVSSFFPNKLAVFCSPVCIYFLALRMIRFPDELLVKYPFIKVTYWVENTCQMGSRGWDCLLWKCLVTVFICLIYGGLTAWRIRKRWHYG